MTVTTATFWLQQQEQQQHLKIFLVDFKNAYVRILQ